MSHEVTMKEIEIALSWLKGEIAIGGVGWQLNGSPTAFPPFRLAKILKQAYALGRIVIVEDEVSH